MGTPYEQTDTSENIYISRKIGIAILSAKFEKMHRFFFCESLFCEIMKNIMEVFNQWKKRTSFIFQTKKKESD